jgi:hypothetical protein
MMMKCTHLCERGHAITFNKKTGYKGKLIVLWRYHQEEVKDQI